MDPSALSEAQQQQQYQQQPYDSAQAQAYYAYYAYHHHHQQQYDAAAAYQNQHYYSQDYSSASTPASAATAYYPPQSAAPPDPAPAPATAPAAQTPDPNDYPQIYAPGTGYPQSLSQEQQGPAYQVPPGLNSAAAAAVAALSQLTQFAGTMDAAERAMAGRQDRQWHTKGGGMTGPMDEGPSQQPPQYHHDPYHHYNHAPHPLQHRTGSLPLPVGGRFPYKGGGGGRRGRGPFRGRGGRGNFDHRPPRQDKSPLPFRDRGRGQISRGGSKRPHQSDPGTQPPHAAPPLRTSPALVVKSSSALEPAQAPPLPTVTAPVLPQLQTAWCELCMAQCNSLEILEQHKNGKRHKKTVRKVEELEAHQRRMAEIKVAAGPEMVISVVEEVKAAVVGEASKVLAQLGELNKASVASVSFPAAVVFAEEGKANKAPTASECVPNPALMTDPQMEPPLLMPLRAHGDGSDIQRGSKRKTARSGRGGKRMRYFETVPEQPVKQPKAERHREQPRFCILCNVMCDTAAVFETHLGGKKHIYRIRQFQGPDVVYGPISAYIPPNQPVPSIGPEPLFYGLRSHEMLQQEAYGLDALQAGSFGPQQGDQGSEHPKVEIGGQEGAVPFPDLLPGLDVKVEEPSANNEESDGATAIQ